MGLSCSAVTFFVMLLLCVGLSCSGVTVFVLLLLCVGLSCSGVTVFVLLLLSVWGCHVVVSVCLSCYYSVCGAVM